MSTPERPQFSVIIAVYNDWAPLEGCLRALEAQANCPEFEVIVIDDGSREHAPESIRREARFAFTLLEQPHAGISVARNLGIQHSKGSVLVFTDADCRPAPDCLSALEAAISVRAQDRCFQLHLTGDLSTVVGRAEELRLMTLQAKMLQPDGHIRYLNTAGFAIRRSHPRVESGLFDPAALRAEDTLLLVNLMQAGELPFFAKGAIVSHSISLSFLGCLCKDIRSAWLEGKTCDMIASMGVRMRMENRERMEMLRSTWRAAREHRIGGTAWFVLLTRQLVERTVSLFYALRGSESATQAGVDF